MSHKLCNVHIDIVLLSSAVKKQTLFSPSPTPKPHKLLQRQLSLIVAFQSDVQAASGISSDSCDWSLETLSAAF